MATRSASSAGSTIESNWAAEHERSIDALRRDVDFLAIQIGPRNLYHYAALAQCADFCERLFYDMGCTPFLQGYNARNRVFRNIGAEIEGSTRRDEIVVVGAHYDTHKNSPGANDNASAIAALFQLARAFAGSRPARTTAAQGRAMALAWRLFSATARKFSCACGKSLLAPTAQANCATTQHQ